jgi:hypothetical protein
MTLEQEKTKMGAYKLLRVFRPEMVDAIDNEVSNWYEVTGCTREKDETADEYINKALGADANGLGLAGGTNLDRAELAEAVHGALTDWNNDCKVLEYEQSIDA